jgi:hypothetical protein
MATTAERNARLDALAKATTEYAEQQTKQLNRRVDVSKRILKGRTGSERLAQAAVQQSSALVVNTINDFLTG